VTSNWGSSGPLASVSTPTHIKIGPAQRSEKELRLPLQVPEDAAHIYTIVASMDWSISTETEFRFEPSRPNVYWAANNREANKTHTKGENMPRLQKEFFSGFGMTLLMLWGVLFLATTGLVLAQHRLTIGKVKSENQQNAIVPVYTRFGLIL
jgi:hypothetical protein